MSEKLTGFDQLAALTGRSLPEKQQNKNVEQEGLVYSTESGRVKAGKSTTRQDVTGDGAVRVLRQRKGRGGKTVTIITGLPLKQEELAKLAKTLKKLAGGGGSVKAGEIVLQGDHRDKMVELLKQRGFDAKPSGG
jgi:translation initiation factor 1